LSCCCWEAFLEESPPDVFNEFVDVLSPIEPKYRGELESETEDVVEISEFEKDECEFDELEGFLNMERLKRDLWLEKNV